MFIQSYNCLPLEVIHNAYVALGENECDTPAIGLKGFGGVKHLSTAPICTLQTACKIPERHRDYVPDVYLMRMKFFYFVMEPIVLQKLMSF